MSEKTGITKVRISADGVEVEVEGTNVSVPDLMMQMTEMRRALGPMPIPQAIAARNDGDASSPSGGAPMVSTNTIASLTDASTGSDLVMAAMAHITLVQRKDTATRREVLDEMRAAKTFYKDSYSGNLSAYLDTLAKGKRLNLVAKETYALPNAERQNFERLIANAN
jgi:hypothetical protein